MTQTMKKAQNFLEQPVLFGGRWYDTMTMLYLDTQIPMERLKWMAEQGEILLVRRNKAKRTDPEKVIG